MLAGRPAACPTAAGEPSATRETKITFPSADGSSRVHACIWEPAPVAEQGARPRGVVQIVHGMSEHIGRYERFARSLCDAGYAVCAHDQVGHGRTAAREDDLGHIPLADGMDILLADVDALRTRMRERYAAPATDVQTASMTGRSEASAARSEVPYIIFGHSLGSFIARVYLTQHGEGVSAAIICGTGQQPRSLARAGSLLCHLLARIHGERYRSALIHSLVEGAYGRAIKGARTPCDWLSTDPAAVDAYRSDPLCGQMFTVGGYAAVTGFALRAQDAQAADRIPHSLPMLFVAGAGDPVGDLGRGVHRAVEQYQSLGMDRVTEIVYPGMRHEILNEPEHALVERDIILWLEGVLPR